MFRIRIRVGDREIEVEGEAQESVQAKFEELKTEFLNRPVAVSPQVVSSGFTGEDIGSLSLSEFLIKKHPASQNDTTLVLGYYLLKARGKNGFTRADIDAAYSEARITKPANLSDVIIQNIRKGYIMDAGDVEGTKSWQITLSGEKYVEEMGSQNNA